MTTSTLQIPKSMHFNLIGKGGSVVRDLQEKFNVRITIPKRDENSNQITLIGKAPDVQKAQQAIEKIVGFKVTSQPIIKSSIEVPKEKHGQLIGKGGNILRDIQTRFSVIITIPKREDESNLIVLEGYAIGIKTAKEEISRILGSGTKVEVKEEIEEKNDVPEKLDLISQPISEAFFFPETDGSQFSRFLDYIRSATKTLDICVFTITDDAISRAIEQMFGQGVAVRVITDDDTSAQQGSDIEEFRKLGIAVKMDKSPFHMHHKFLIIDNLCLLNGSFNWTKQARENNCENIMITNDKKFVQLYSDHFNKMWNDTKNFFP